MPTGVYQRQPVLERFLAKVDKNGPNGCWIWLASKGPNGYGQFCLEGTRPLGAHRVALKLFRGVDIMYGHALTIDHLCHNPICVNPDHLEVVPQAVNTARRRRSRGWKLVRSSQPFCVKGHPFTEDNTYRLQGHRHCRACHAQRERARRQRIAGAAR
jgi:hypothetical protein